MLKGQYLKYTDIERIGSNEFQIEESEFGPVLKLRSAWTPTIRRVIEERGIQGLILTRTYAWTDKHVEFLRELPNLRSLILRTSDELDITPVYELSRLRSLDLETHKTPSVDFSRFPDLRRVSIWGRPMYGALQLTGLESVSFCGLPQDKVAALGSLSNLTDLHIYGSRAESLDPLRHLGRLKKLNLCLCKNLRENRFLEDMAALEIVWIQDCAGFRSLAPFANLKNLREVSFDSCGPFESLKPFAGCQELRSFCILDKRWPVLDGDYSPVEDLPNLERYYR